MLDPEDLEWMRPTPSRRGLRGKGHAVSSTAPIGHAHEHTQPAGAIGLNTMRHQINVGDRYWQMLNKDQKTGQAGPDG